MRGFLWLACLAACIPLLSGSTVPAPTTLSFAITDAVEMRNFQSVSCGARHTCAIKRQTPKQMVCFGLNDHGQISVPTAEGWEMVSAGWLHTCGIDVDGVPQCWGDNTYGQCNVPSTLNRPLQIMAGKTHTCAINSDNSITCWGDASLDKLDAPTDPNYQSICVAASHACAVNTTGQITCWGYNGNDRASVPRSLSTEVFLSVACKGAHTCGLDGNQTLHCWGHDGHGQTDIILTHVTKQWAMVATGSFTTCAIRVLTEEETACSTTAATVTVPTPNTICWGDSSYGQGNVPLRPIGWKTRESCNVMQWVSVDAGGYHACGITQDDDQSPSENLLRCWGLEDDGQLEPADSSAHSLTAAIPPVPWLLVGAAVLSAFVNCL